MIRNADKWALKMHADPLLDCFGEDKEYKIRWQNTIYLSPDSDVPLLDFDVDQTNFILGGLIDRTVVKNATKLKHQALNIEAMKCCRLPIEEFCDFQDEQK